jgi:hypothetical protein
MEVRVYKESNRDTDKLITLSLFKMKHAYRNFNIYVRATQNVIQILHELYPAFNIRIYTDATTLNDEHFKVLNTDDPQLEIHVYSYPPMVKDEYHEGTFGTIMRIYPMFIKDDYRIVWSSDVDLPRGHFQDMKPYVDSFCRNKRDLLVYQYFHYDKPYSSADHEINIVMGIFLSKIKFPTHIFTDFLEDLEHGKYATIVDKLNENRQSKSYPPTQFPYGTDELFLNMVLYDKIIDRKWTLIKDYNLDKKMKSLYYHGNKNSELIQHTKLSTSYFNDRTPQLFKQLKKVYVAFAKKYELTEFTEHVPEFVDTFWVEFKNG